ncbi:prolyl oligopeptidase family serine peptidase [Candidatus Fermentibacteria bacterium]|nr:prolyl oligopeptidase family serine peptidase [Candidatus Fermentibacteria bacterium]
MTDSDLPLVPRRTYFGNPRKVLLRISPDGRRIGFLAPLDGVMNIWVAPLHGFEEAEPVTSNTHRGIRWFQWTYSPGRLIYIRDSDGDENFHVYCVEVDSGRETDLTPVEGVSAFPTDQTPRLPDKILVSMNDRDPRFRDVHAVDLSSGERELLVRNDGFAGFGFDLDLELVDGVRYLEDGGAECLLWHDDEWEPLYRVGPEDTINTGPVITDADGRLWLTWSRDRNTSALRSLDLRTGEWKTHAEHPKADFTGRGMLIHPTTRSIQAGLFEYERMEYQVIDDDVREDIDYLQTLGRGDPIVTSRNLDDDLWIVALTPDDRSRSYHLYYREQKKTELLCHSRPELNRINLSRMHPTVIESRDGMGLVSYFTLPSRLDSEEPVPPDTPLPMVLLVHGGPWARDHWGYSPRHQWLANRGYFVLSVNFRGSTGLGKSYVNAGNGEWAGKMHRDLVDAVQWAVDKGYADGDRVAIMGGSYGGYATLVGLTFTPEVFTCGVDRFGPSNLVTLLQNVPEYWAPMMPMMGKRIGAFPDNDDGKQYLLERSPITRADRIVRPLLIGQGSNDPRVTKMESDQIVGAMREKGLPVTYLLYPDEGHGFQRPENRTSFFAVAGQFLSEHLGGRCQPIGEDMEGSSMEVLDDGDLEAL